MKNKYLKFLIVIIYLFFNAAVVVAKGNVDDNKSYQLGVNFYILRSDFKGYDNKYKDFIIKRKSDYIQRNITDKTIDQNGDLITSEEETTKIDLAKLNISPPAIPNINNAIPNQNITPFDPRILIIPESPAIGEIKEPEINKQNFKTGGANPRVGKHYIFSTSNNGSNNYANISEIIVEDGKFIRNKDGLDQNITIQNYKAKAPHGIINLSLGGTLPENNLNDSNVINIGNIYSVPDGTYKQASSQGYSGITRFFYVLTNTPYTYFGENVKIFDNTKQNSSSDISSLINLETEGNINKTLEELRDEKAFSNDNDKNIEVYNKIKNYRELSADNILSLSNKKHTLFFENKGLAEIGENLDSFFFTTTHSFGANRINVIENSGKIVVLPGDKSRAVFFHSPDTGSNETSYVYANSGNLDILSSDASAMVFSASSSSNPRNKDALFVNKGNINLYSKNSIGIALNDVTLKNLTGFHLLKPINLIGNNSIGVYNKNRTNYKSYSGADIVIGGVKKTEYKSDIIDKNYTIDGGQGKKTTQAIGIVYDRRNGKNSDLIYSNITINGDSNGSVGVFPINNSKIDMSNPNDTMIGDFKNSLSGLYKAYENKLGFNDTNVKEFLKHTINIEGGINNIGIAVTDGSDVTYGGDINIYTKEGDLFNKAILAKGNNTPMKFKGNLKVGKNKNDLAYNPIVLSTINGGKLDLSDSKIDMFIKATDKSTIAAYSKGQNSVLDFGNSKPNVYIEGVNNKGIAFFAEDKGSIIANEANITAENISTALAAKNGGIVKATNSTIYYNGEGYFAFSDENSDVNISGSTINLDGKASGFKVEKDITNKYIVKGITKNNSKINVLSNDVVVFILTDYDDEIKTSEPNFKDKDIFKPVLDDLNFNPGDINQSKAPNSVLATIDGLNKYIVDTNIDKKEAVKAHGDNFNTASDLAKISYNFSKNVKVQRAKIILKDGNSIKSHLTSDDMEKLNYERSGGIEISSSKKENGITDQNETSITLEKNTLIDVANTSGGENGSIGLYTNYGIIDTAKTSKIILENTNNPTKNSVGVYSISSKVETNGSIDSYGYKSVGILSYVYRRTDTEHKNDNFSNDYGEASIINNGKITMHRANSSGIYLINNTVDTNNPSDVKDYSNFISINNGNINMKSKNSSGMVSGGAISKNNGIININGTNSVGMLGVEKSLTNKIYKSVLENSGIINLNLSNSIGMLNNSEFDGVLPTITLKNSGKILGSKIDSIAIGGNNIIIEDGASIVLGKNSYGIHLKNDSISSGANAKITVGNMNKFELEENSVYLYAQEGDNSKISDEINVDWKFNSTLNIKDSSTAIYLGSSHNKAKAILNAENIDFILGNNSAGIYSNFDNSNLNIKGNIKTESNNSFGIYMESGSLINKANIDMQNGTENIGIYAKNPKNLENNATIKVGKSTLATNKYSIGVAVESDINNQKEFKNYGTIEVFGERGIGVYAKNSKVTNKGTIELKDGATNSIGIFADNSEIVNETDGKILVNAKNGIGIYMINHSILKNYGDFIVTGDGAIAISKDDTIEDSDIVGVDSDLPTDEISDNPSNVTGNIINSGINNQILIDLEINPDKWAILKRVDAPMDNNVELKFNTNINIIDPAKHNHIEPGNTVKKTLPENILAIYIDTSGVKNTNPIQGLNSLSNLQTDIYIGAEATTYSTAKSVDINKSIAMPFMEVIENANPLNVSFNSGSLTWQAGVKVDEGENSFAKRYGNFVLLKIPYEVFAKKDDNYLNLYKGLDDLYSSNKKEEREIFNKINMLGNAEKHIFDQTIEQIAGNQYANMQHRVRSTYNMYDREFYELLRWESDTKDTTKFKIFGENLHHKTKTMGLSNYKKQAYGFFVLDSSKNNEFLNDSGWFAGIAQETFKLDDIGNSKEKSITTQVGFYNDSYLNKSNFKWLSKTSLNLSQREMERKFLVVDSIYNAKSKYYTAGIEWNNRLYRPYLINDSLNISPYIGLDLSYTIIKNIKEDDGPLKLKINSKNLYVIAPKIGTEFIYKHILSDYSLIKTVFDINIYKDFGNGSNAQNKARLLDSYQDYYYLRRDRKDRFGVAGKLGIKYENKNFGMGITAGYETDDKNKFLGIDFRIKF